MHILDWIGDCVISVIIVRMLINVHLKFISIFNPMVLFFLSLLFLALKIRNQIDWCQ